jgi:DNA-binding GntR family transcriptional regulator
VPKSKKLKTLPPGKENTEQRHQRIYKMIRERISLLQYSPGTVLSEAELASEFKISRTPIRRVLQRLNYEGLTEIRNGVGTIVSDIDIKTLKEIYDLRMHLAELMGELSPREFIPEQRTELKRLLKGAKALKISYDYEGYARICNDLEEVVLSMIGSAPLREITDILYYRVSRIWFTFLPELNWKEMVNFQEQEISSLLDAVKRNDLKGVGQIRRYYLRGILKYLSNYLSEHNG